MMADKKTRGDRPEDLDETALDNAQGGFTLNEELLAVRLDPKAAARQPAEVIRSRPDGSK